MLSFTDNGNQSVGRTYGKKNILQKFKRYVEKSIDWDQLCRIGIAHANCESIATRWGEDFGERIGKENVFVSEVGPALGVHSGPGGMVIACQNLKGEVHD